MSLFLARADRMVVGADVTRASLQLGAAAAQRFGLDRVLFVETDLQRPGLAAGAFDVVFSSGVLHHTARPARIVRFASRGSRVRAARSCSASTTRSRASRCDCGA